MIRPHAFQGFDPLPTQKVPALYYFDISSFSDEKKKILKAPLTPIYSKFEGGARAEKMQFFGQKVLFWPVFSYICLRCRYFGRNRDFVVHWESSKNLFGRPKRRSTEFSKIFENLPLEKILDTPPNSSSNFLRALEIFTKTAKKIFN